LKEDLSMNQERLQQFGRIALCAATCTGGFADAQAQLRHESDLRLAGASRTQATGQRDRSAADSTLLLAQAGASSPVPEPAPRAGGPEPVGQAPEPRKPEVAPLGETPGVLTPKGKFVFEPSFQYSYSTSNRVMLVGYTIIPAIVIGLIDVREVKRTSITATLAGRYGLGNRAEVELRLPYVLRNDDTVSRPLATGSSIDTTSNAKGHDIGDIELVGRYQLNDGGADKPFYVASLRFKTRTGKDPFEVNTGITGLQTELPTGSGFYGLQPALTVLYPSDPAVLFGTISYLHSFARDNVTLLTDNVPQPVGKVAPGGVFGVNFGMGLALNEKSSFSIGYEHSLVNRTKINGEIPPGNVRLQLGTLLLGFSHRLNEQQTLSFSLGAGLTSDTPNVSLTLRVPTTF
jgi:hypothetical protein